MTLGSIIRNLTGHPAERPSPAKAKRTLSRDERRHVQFSFSQFGEDLAVMRHFENRLGFYVDIGAHHPIRFSNTHSLYRRGWSGINVDANEEAIELFKIQRPRDVNLQGAVSNEVREVEFSLYEDSALSRIELTSGPAAAGNSRMPPPARKVRLQTTTLERLLSEHLPRQQAIDFLNVDCEGHDLAVLTSNDWTRFRPELVAVEDWQMEGESAIDRFLATQGYALAFLQKPAKIFVRAAPSAATA